VVHPAHGCPLEAGGPDGGEDDADDGYVVVGDHEVVAHVEPVCWVPDGVDEGEDEMCEAEDTGNDEIGEGEEEDASKAVEEGTILEDSLGISNSSAQLHQEYD
jgi:hypothetical protein